MAPHAEKLTEDHTKALVWKKVSGSEHSPNDTSSYGYQLTHALLNNPNFIVREVEDDLGKICDEEASEEETDNLPEREIIYPGKHSHAELFL